MTQYGRITNILTGVSVEVYATTEHPDSHYGHEVWVDNEGKAWFEVGGKRPFNYRVEIFGVHKCARIDIGKRIAQLRKQQGMTQAELGDHAGVTAANISRIETGRYSPGLDVLARIANTLGCELAIIEKPST
jgi:DNA-binding XRE family transcriptional regulator